MKATLREKDAVFGANVRPTNTEPYLRLVMEAKDEASLRRHMAEVMALLGEPAD